MRVLLIVQCARRNHPGAKRRPDGRYMHGALHIQRQGYVQDRRDPGLSLRRGAAPAGKPLHRSAEGTRHAGGAGGAQNPPGEIIKNAPTDWNTGSPSLKRVSPFLKTTRPRRSARTRATATRVRPLHSSRHCARDWRASRRRSRCCPNSPGS